jgi:hypothetical protein
MNERFWTEADDAELRLLAFHFAKAHYLHRGHCLVCGRGGPYCIPLREALEAILDWRTGRILANKAAWLREREAMRNEAA